MKPTSSFRYLAAVAFATILLGCSGKSSPTDPSSSGGSVTDYDSLVTELRAAGFQVEPAGQGRLGFFTPEGSNLRVNGDLMQIFEYSDARTAAEEANRLAPDGSSTPTLFIHWAQPPHFYRKGRLIVLYAGSNAAILRTLPALLGNQFAGY